MKQALISINIVIFDVKALQDVIRPGHTLPGHKVRIHFLLGNPVKPVRQDHRVTLQLVKRRFPVCKHPVSLLIDTG
ncbi:MAG: hypothetical protein RLZZ487_661 [Pseudomonadota bacterium]